MIYDELVDKILHESIFGNSYEKRTGIKRQIALEADKETQVRKEEKIRAAAFITAEMMNEIFENMERDETIPEPTRDDYIRLAFAALGVAGFDDQALQRAFDDPTIKAVPDEFTLSDFRKYHELLELVFSDTQYKFLSPERIRKILKELELVVAELVKQNNQSDEEELEPDTQSGGDDLSSRVGMSSDAMARLRAQGLVS